MAHFHKILNCNRMPAVSSTGTISFAHRSFAM